MKTNKWKMALLVWSAMFPFSTVMTYALTQLPFTAQLPLVARTFCLTCLLVPYMVCVALPFLTQRFQKWLHENPRNETMQPPQTMYKRSAKIQSETGRTSRKQYAML
ncbi:hypothetical protein [Spirosoma daeguense]